MNMVWLKGFLLGFWHVTKGAIAATIFMCAVAVATDFFMEDEGNLSLRDRLDMIEARLSALESR